MRRRRPPAPTWRGLHLDDQPIRRTGNEHHKPSTRDQGETCAHSHQVSPARRHSRAHARDDHGDRNRRLSGQRPRRRRHVAFDGIDRLAFARVPLARPPPPRPPRPQRADNGLDRPRGRRRRTGQVPVILHPYFSEQIAADRRRTLLAQAETHQRARSQRAPTRHPGRVGATRRILRQLPLLRPRQRPTFTSDPTVTIEYPNRAEL